jgi:single-strand DNA-binding protein
MSKTLNKVILIGRAGKDPELSNTNNGSTVAKLSVATDTREKQGDTWVDGEPEWHNVVLWNRQAEIAGQYVKKGDKVYIEGRLQTRKYEKDGTTKYFTEVVANDLILLGGKREAEPEKAADDFSKF